MHSGSDLCILRARPAAPVNRWRAVTARRGCAQAGRQQQVRTLRVVSVDWRVQREEIATIKQAALCARCSTTQLAILGRQLPTAAILCRAPSLCVGRLLGASSRAPMSLLSTAGGLRCLVSIFQAKSLGQTIKSTLFVAAAVSLPASGAQPPAATTVQQFSPRNSNHRRLSCSVTILGAFLSLSLSRSALTELAFARPVPLHFTVR